MKWYARCECASCADDCRATKYQAAKPLQPQVVADDIRRQPQITGSPPTHAWVTQKVYGVVNGRELGELRWLPKPLQAQVVADHIRGEP